MSWRRAKTSGWAAFDPKKQQKEVIDNETQNHPYPPISSNISAWDHRQNRSRNGDLTGRSFSSVLAHSASVPNMMASEDNRIPLYEANIENLPNLVAVRDVPDRVHAHTLVENSQSERMTAKYIANDVSQLYEKLKELHPWANENLIEDIVTAVDTDIDKALALLREMASPGRLPEKKETEFEDNIEEVYLDSSRLENTGLHIGETTTFPESSQVSQSRFAIKNDEPSDDHASGKVFRHDNVPLGLIMDRLSMVPVEPEWEDDDMYLMHRKEAIRAMRLASRHSKAATEAYLRRDHAAAQEFSAKAEEEWRISEKLNAKAAKEILAIRNCENDDWKLDLHGLHAAEAVEVLLEHLLKIESQVSGTHSKKPDKTNLKVRSTQAASLESVNPETEKSDIQQASRPRLLEVITGKGSHSRGQAALPVAIKSFLSEKGYYYYEARIGVIAVQPKFRQLSTALLNR